MANMESLKELCRRQNFLVFVFTVSSHLLCITAKPAAFIDVPKSFAIRNGEPSIPITPVHSNTLQQDAFDANRDNLKDNVQEQDITSSESTSLNSPFTNTSKSTSSPSVNGNSELHSSIRNSKTRHNDKLKETEKNNVHTPRSSSLSTQNLRSHVPFRRETLSDNEQQQNANSVNSPLNSNDGDSKRRKEINSAISGLNVRKVEEPVLHRKKNSSLSPSISEDYGLEMAPTLFDTNAPSGFEDLHQQMQFQNTQPKPLVDANSELFKILESNAQNRADGMPTFENTNDGFSRLDSLQQLMWLMLKDDFDHYYNNDNNRYSNNNPRHAPSDKDYGFQQSAQYPPHQSNDDSSDFDSQYQMPNDGSSFKLSTDSVQTPVDEHVVDHHGIKPEVEYVPRRSTRTHYHNPRPLYTHPVQRKLDMRQGISTLRRMERSRSRARSSRRTSTRATSGYVCNHRRVTREMLLQFFITGKMCGSNVVRIRFGLG